MWGEPFCGCWRLHTISLPFVYTFLTICLLSVSCAGCIARGEGSHFGVAGGCLPFPYHLLALSLSVAYYLLHVQDGEQDVMGAILGLLAVANHFPTIWLHFPYQLLTIRYMCRMESNVWGEPFWGCWRLPTISLPFAYTFLTICLLYVTCAGWIARCEGSHFGIAGGCQPFPYHLLTLPLPCAYYLLHVQDG